MFTNSALIVVAWLITRFIYGVEWAPLLDQLAVVVEANRWALLVAGLLGAAALPVVSLACRGIGYYSLMFTMDKLFLSLGRFLVCLLAVGAIIFWFDSGVNLWSLLGITTLLPFAALGSAAFSLYLFDFNYPLKDVLGSAAILAATSLLVVSLATVWS